MIPHKPYLGKLIVKVCPWCKQEFKTDNKSQVYCIKTHLRAAQKSRYRKHKYAEREIVVSSKPGASYNLHFQERPEDPPEKNLKPSREVLYYTKAPIRHSADLVPTGQYNLPDLSGSECEHGNEGYCAFCDFR